MVKTLPSLIASLRHYFALYQGNILPLPGTKRYVGRENPHSLFYSSPFTKSAETPINTGGARGEGFRQPFTTLHPPFTLIIFGKQTLFLYKGSIINEDQLQASMKTELRDK